VAKCDEGGLNKESVGGRKEKTKENRRTEPTGAATAVSFANKTWSSDANRKERRCGIETLGGAIYVGIPNVCEGSFGIFWPNLLDVDDIGWSILV
jgi:hypothetical protein